MIKIENVEVVGLKHALRGMRNAKNSWDKSDSIFSKLNRDGTCSWFDTQENPLPPCTCASLDELKEDNATNLLYGIGPNDQDLCNRLANGGSVHAKYRRMITVYLDVVAPLYWWKEYDTYKVGTVANSCSTMHKIHEKEFTLEDFSYGHLINNYEEVDTLGYTDSPYISPKLVLALTCEMLNIYREKFVSETDPEIKKDYWWQMIQLLPSSYNQRRTLMLNYEVLANIYKWRKDHKLDEWKDFCKWIETLPYSEIITGEKGDN